MISESHIRQLADQFLAGTGQFIVDLLIKPGNKILITIDGEQRVNIDVCIRLSRFIESHFDRETEDFDLTVSTPGIDKPLRDPRQFRKNVGHQLEIETADGDKFTATVQRAGDDSVDLEKVPVKKGKKTEESVSVTLTYPQIKSAKEVITFKKQ